MESCVDRSPGWFKVFKGCDYMDLVEVAANGSVAISGQTVTGGVLSQLPGRSITGASPPRPI